MKAGLLALFSCSFCLHVGCSERDALVGKPNTYSKGGITFKYPGNWKVGKDTVQDGKGMIEVGSPISAVCIIMIIPASNAMEFEEFAKDFSREFEESIPVGKVKTSDFSKVSKLDNFETITENFSITILNAKVPHTRVYRRNKFGNSICSIIEQAPDADLSKVEKGFDQITSTLQLLEK